MDSPPSSLPALINTNAVTERRNMKAKVGLWIDHRKAIIVVLTEKGEETKRIESTVEKQLRRSGRSPSNESFVPHWHDQ
jgi:2'-5' RNA ligase